MMDEELILSTLAALMPQVRWTRPGDDPDARRFITTSRRLKLFSDVPSASQPACFQAEYASNEEQRTGLPYKATLEVRWVIFQDVAKDPHALGTLENNLILGGIRAALAPQPTDPGFLDKRNTLGGLVHHCFMSGKIFKDPGDLDGQGMLDVPIMFLVP